MPILMGTYFLWVLIIPILHRWLLGYTIHDSLYAHDTHAHNPFSAITLQFVQGIFVENYEPTIGMLTFSISCWSSIAIYSDAVSSTEDFYRKEVEIGGKEVALQIIDTASPAVCTYLQLLATMRTLFSVCVCLHLGAVYCNTRPLHKELPWFHVSLQHHQPGDAHSLGRSA